MRANRETVLQTDLTLNGDNLLDVIERLHTDLGVDLSAFDLQRYGHGEAYYLNPVRLLDGIRGVNNMQGKEAITLGMIEDALITGSWIS